MALNRKRKSMTLSEYIKKRNGVPLGTPNSLSNNLHRSLGAKNFSTFWKYWNPIFGYVLGYYVFKPLRKFTSPEIALMLTFFICGLFHDLVTLLFAHKTSFLFSFWFILMAISVLISRLIKQNLFTNSWIIRASANLLIIGSTLVLAFYLKSLAGFEFSLN